MCVAIKTTTSMVLISIQPFALRKIFLVIAALLCFSALCLADPLFVTQRYSAPASERAHLLKGVDFPSRGQESLPNSADPAAGMLHNAEVPTPAPFTGHSLLA